MAYQYIKSSITEHILTITIDRADKLNALNTTLLQEIKSEVDKAQDNDDVWGIILTGDGDKAFAAGADIAEFANFNKSEGEAMSRAGHQVMNSLENSIKPTVAAVKGYSLGGGCELAMACHMRIASDTARFGQPEVNLGILPGYGGTQRLAALIGRGKAIEFLMTGSNIKADEALALGLVNYVVPADEVLAKAVELLNKIATKSPQAVADVIRSVNDYSTDGVDGMENEIKRFGASFETPEFTEGTAAFVGKRRADFRK